MKLFQKVIIWLRKFKIQHRLLMIFFFVSLVPVISIGLFSYNVYTKSINSKLGQSSEQAVYLLNNNLITQLEKFKDYCSLISVSEDVQDALSIPPGDELFPNEKLIYTIKDLLENIPFQSKYLKSLRVVDRAGNILYDLGYDDISKVQFQSILNGIDRTSPKDTLQYIRTYRSYDKIVLGRKIFNPYRVNDHVGYILIFIDNRLLTENIFSNVSFGPNSNIMLIDSSGNIVSSQDPAKLGSNIATTQLFKNVLVNKSKNVYSFNTTIDSKNYLVIYNYNATYNNYLVSTIPYSYITSEAKSINMALTLLGCALILICLVSTFIVYFSIVQPIRKMILFCNVTDDNDLEKRINDTSNDELSFLAKTINQMLTKIKLFTLDWKKQQQYKRELELEMLQYQINPHFLFNTLNTLKWIAVINEVPTLSEGISSLSALLQSTLMKKDALISIQEEISNLSHYFSIQKLRYADSFDVEYNLDEQILNYRVPRFILQPLAENAIIHGTEDKDIPMKIFVNCSTNSSDYIIIEIIDDGKGFDAKEVFEKSKERFTGIGVSNVDERIHLHYGSDFGLTITSTPGKGTTCRIQLPKEKIEVTYNND